MYVLWFTWPPYMGHKMIFLIFEVTWRWERKRGERREFRKRIMSCIVWEWKDWTCAWDMGRILFLQSLEPFWVLWASHRLRNSRHLQKNWGAPALHTVCCTPLFKRRPHVKNRPSAWAPMEFQAEGADCSEMTVLPTATCCHVSKFMDHLQKLPDSNEPGWKTL